MGFLVLAGVLLATRAAVSPGPGPLPEPPIAKGGERDTGHKVVVKVQPAREPAPRPASGSSPYELGRYEERRRVQERMRHADAADYEDGNLSAARNLYDYAAAASGRPSPSRSAALKAGGDGRSCGSCSPSTIGRREPIGQVRAADNISPDR